MTKKQFYILLSVLLVAVLIFSNPSEENHIESVKSKLKIAFKKKMSSELTKNQNDTFATLGNGLGLLLGDTFIDKLTDGLVTRKNYILFSLTSFEYKGKEKTIGFGILGNVFLSDKIENIFQQNEQKKVENEENAYDDNSTKENENEISDEDFKNSLPNSNPNSNKFEFTDEMLVDRNQSHSDLKDFYQKEEDFCYGEIIEVIDDFGGIKVKMSKANTLPSDYSKVGDEMTVYFDAVEYNGKSKMCETCAEDFRELIKVGRKIKFVPLEIGNGTASNGIFSLIYINIAE
jgi:hypothetical protein